ncbi:MAG: DUF4157 domain-containing protein, partial [Bacteroidota bacterium]
MPIKQTAMRDEPSQARERPSAGLSFPAPNATGLPGGLKAKMENSFGTPLDGLRVHKNSSFPAKVGAIATTQGNRIDFAPGHYNPHTARGQRLIGHEAWHTVQQAQGRVKPTLQMKTGHLVNDNSVLEQEANRAGEAVAASRTFAPRTYSRPSTGQTAVVQCSVSWTHHSVNHKTPLLALADELPNITNFYLDPAANWDHAAIARDSIKYHRFAKMADVPHTVRAEIAGSRRPTNGRLSDPKQSLVGLMGDQEVGIRNARMRNAYEGGHLVGDQLFLDAQQSYEYFNLAPQSRKFNSPVYSQLLEALLKKGAKHLGTLAHNQSIPIMLDVQLTYDAPAYTVTVKQLKDREILDAKEVAASGYADDKSITIPTRIPHSWTARAQLDTRGLDPAEVNQWEFGRANFITKQAGFYHDTPATQGIPAREFLFNLSRTIQTDADGSLKVGGGQDMTLTAYHGLPESDTVSLNPGVITAPLQPVQALFDEPFRINELTSDDLTNLVKRVQHRDHRVITDGNARKITRWLIELRQRNGSNGIESYRQLRVALNRTKGGKLPAKTADIIHDLFNPVNCDYSPSTDDRGYDTAE